MGAARRAGEQPLMLSEDRPAQPPNLSAEWLRQVQKRTALDGLALTSVLSRFCIMQSIVGMGPNTKH